MTHELFYFFPSPCLSPGCGPGGSQPQVRPRQPHHLLHDGGGRGEEAGDRSGGGGEGHVGHPGGLHYKPPAANCKGTFIEKDFSVGERMMPRPKNWSLDFSSLRCINRLFINMFGLLAFAKKIIDTIIKD